jgi:hypothetical protein
MIPVSYYFLIASLFIAFACSLINFRLHAVHLKIFSVLLGIDLLNELLASFGMSYLRAWYGLKSNLPIYNSFILVEFMMYAMFFFYIVEIKWFRKFIITFMMLFPLLWLISVFYIFGISGWNSYIQVAGSTFTILASIVFLYQLYTQEELVSLSRNTEFWISVSLLVFYICNLPYTGMLNYLIKNYEPLAVEFAHILTLLNIVMYSIIIYAFLCRIKTTKSSLT